MMRKKYNPEVYQEWYKKNKDRIHDAKRTSKKKYRRTDAGRAAQRRYNSKPSRKLYVKKYRLNKDYGIIIEEYGEMLVKQNGRCAICNREYLEKLHVDHNHKTKKVRGLLCGSCNRAIGLFGDDVNLMTSAIDYLNE